MTDSQRRPLTHDLSRAYMEGHCCREHQRYATDRLDLA